MQFTYDACTPEGNIVSGQLIAKSVEEAQKQLHHQGLFVLSLRTHRRNISLIRKLLARMLPYNSRIRFLSRFVRQISALGRAGLPFITSIQIIADETKHPIYKQAFTKLGQDVALGKPLADAISRQGHLFPPLLIQMTAAAEATGNLEEVYSRLGDNYERELEFRRKIVGAAVYPVLVLLLALFGAIGVSKIVLPQVEELLAYSNAPLPMATRIILFLGQPVVWHQISLTFGLLLLLAFVFFLTPFGAAVQDSLQLRIPIIGPLILHFHLARTCHCLSLCLDCGIHLLAALDIAEDAALNRNIQGEIKKMKAGTRIGLGLTSQLRALKVIPRFLVQMVRVGEETGSLPEMLGQAADILDKDVHHALDMTITWLEPMLIIVAGVVVGFVVFGLMMPLLTLVDSIS